MSPFVAATVGFDGGEATGYPEDPLDVGIQFDLATGSLDDFAGALPHHARTFARILKLVDEGLDYLSLFLILWREKGIFQGRVEREVFDSLGGPFRLDLFAAHSPDLSV